MNKNSYPSGKDSSVRLLLRTIRKDGPASRAQLARKLGLTCPAVTNIVTPLLNKGILRELGCSDIPHGRKPILLDLDPGACFALGMVLTTETVTAVVTDFRAGILCKRQYSITPLLGRDWILRMLIQAAKECIHDSGINADLLVGLGIAAPGPLDIQSGTLINPPNFSDWDHVPICQIMEQALGIPAILDKETNAAALAEYYFNDFKGEKTSFYISLFENSIGGSILLNGKCIHGFGDGAGEIGHMQVDPSGPKCSCGNFGCLESIACGEALLHQARVRLIALNRLQDSNSIQAEEITLEKIFQYSNEHIPLFEEIVGHAALMIATAIGNVATILSPSLVTIGGTLPVLSPHLVDQIREYVHQRPYPGTIRNIRIEPSVLGEDGCAIGAAVLALDYFLLPPEE